MRKRVVLLGLVLIFCLILFVEFSYGVVYGRLSGRVVRKSTGEGLEGVTIWIDSQDRFHYSKKVITDKDGYFRVEKLYPQRYLLYISGTNGLLPEKHVITVQLKSGEERYIEVAEELAGRITGSVLIKDKNGIRPLSGVIVCLRGKTHRHPMYFKTKEDGKYILLGLEGEFFIEVKYNKEKLIYKKYVTKIYLGKGQEIKQPDIVFDFTNKTGVEGYVYSENSDRPIEDVNVCFYRDEEVFKNINKTLVYCEVYTDSNGYYNAYPLPYGEINILFNPLSLIERKLSFEEMNKYLIEREVKIKDKEIVFVEAKLKTE